MTDPHAHVDNLPASIIERAASGDGNHQRWPNDYGHTPSESARRARAEYNAQQRDDYRSMIAVSEARP